jgi:hypothetical protein
MKHISGILFSRSDGDQRTVRDCPSEIDIVKVQARPERIQRQSRRPSEAIRLMIAKVGRSIRGTARASDSSAPARESSAFQNPSCNGREQLMSGREESRSEKLVKARKVAEQKRVLEAVS